MNRLVTYAALAFAFACLSPKSANAQNQSVQSTEPVLAKDLAPAKGGGKLIVTSNAFRSGTSLDDKYTQNGSNMSPPISWNKGPLGTQSYVLLAEDPGVNRPEPISHWVIYDIPSSITYVLENLPRDARLPNGAMQGLNIGKAAGFVGPKPPAGQTHPYHFQVFALNKRLNLDPASVDRNAIVDAMKGHVLATGDLVALYTGK